MTFFGMFSLNEILSTKVLNPVFFSSKICLLYSAIKIIYVRYKHESFCFFRNEIEGETI